MSKRPNLFKYATSELSQDAFLSWLLSWADSKFANEDKTLHLTARKFLNSIGKKFGICEFGNESCNLMIEINTQHKGIDVLAEVTVDKMEKYAIVIEDKIHATPHSNQLERYKNEIFKESSGKYKKILLLYFKTGEISQYRQIEEAGFKVYSRKELLSTITNHSSNVILNDFMERLVALDHKYNSYSEKSFECWKRNYDSWEGFFSALRKQFEKTSKEKIFEKWEYVSNQSGGELIFELKRHKIEDGEVYLQICKKLGEGEWQERYYMCFRVGEIPGNCKPSDVRWDLNQSIIQAAKGSCWEGVVDKPRRFGAGASMIFAETKQDQEDAWLMKSGGKLDLPEIVKKVCKADRLLLNTVNNYQQRKNAQ